MSLIATLAPAALINAASSSAVLAPMAVVSAASCTVALAPVVISLISIMGQKNFDKLVQSHWRESLMPGFNSEAVFAAVKACDLPYEYDEIGLKILVGPHKMIFQETENSLKVLWPLIVPAETVLEIMATIESFFGRSVFETKPERVKNEESTSIDTKLGGTLIPDEPKWFPTLYTDGELLYEALMDNGLEPFTLPNGDLVVEEAAGYRLTFRPGDSGEPYSVLAEYSPTANILESKAVLNTVQDNYLAGLQNRTYERVLAGAADRGWEIESEEISSDNSVVITLSVG